MLVPRDYQPLRRKALMVAGLTLLGLGKKHNNCTVFLRKKKKRTWTYACMFVCMYVCMSVY